MNHVLCALSYLIRGLVIGLGICAAVVILYSVGYSVLYYLGYVPNIPLWNAIGTLIGFVMIFVSGVVAAVWAFDYDCND